MNVLPDLYERDVDPVIALGRRIVLLMVANGHEELRSDWSAWEISAEFALADEVVARLRRDDRTRPGIRVLPQAAEHHRVIAEEELGELEIGVERAAPAEPRGEIDGAHSVPPRFTLPRPL